MTEIDGGAFDAGARDAGVRTDAGASSFPDAGTVDAGAADAGAPDAGVRDAGSVVLADYVPCTLDIDCPTGLGRCQKTFPLHHPDVSGAATVSASAVFPSLPPGQGVCAETCEQSPLACAASAYLTSALTFTCQVVYGAPSPYQAGVLADAGAMAQGIVAFAAICRPPLAAPQNCASCTDDSTCGSGQCVDLSTQTLVTDGGVGACLFPCGAGDSCPGGFTCQSARCVPVLATCGACADLDHDGKGLGFCGAGNTVTPVDCDDHDPSSAWAAPRQCGAVDHDCNGFTDATDMVGTDAYGSQHCSACNDACPTPANATIPGLQWVCQGPVGQRTCQSACAAGLLDCDGVPGCEVGSTTVGHQFAPDSDGDGFSCNPAINSLTCVVKTACSTPAGYALAAAYNPAPSSCSAASCPDADEAHASVHPGAPERCDGLDNDQNGAIDDGFHATGSITVCADGTLGCASAPSVTLNTACTATCGAGTGAGTWTCAGVSGIVCAGNATSPEIACNGLDDNCNGRVDEPLGDACDVSAAPPGTLDSPCWRAATRDCHGTCVPSPASAHATDLDLPGDSYDADCDGSDLQGDAVYVWSGSSITSATGAAATPFRDLRSALTLAATRPTKTIYVQDAVNTPVILTGGPIALTSGWHLIGGFSGGTAWTLPAASSPAQSRVCLPPSAVPVTYTALGVTRAAWVGLTCTGSTAPTNPVVFENLKLDVAKTGCGAAALDVPATVAGLTAGWGVSSYGAVFIDCDQLVLTNASLNAATPPAPALPTTPVGLTGANGSSIPLALAGGWGGAGGGSYPAGCTICLSVGQSGSSLASNSGSQNTSGGVGGAGAGAFSAPVPGSSPTTFGTRGTGGVAAATTNFLPANNPSMAVGLMSYTLLANGFVQFPLSTQYQGASGQTVGGFGYGAGGGGFGSSGFPLPFGGRGGQGGGGGPVGIGGAGGGDTVGLVLLGTQLPSSCQAGFVGLIPCGSNVYVTAGAAAPGGTGGTGGTGGAGGPGAPPATSGSSAGAAGGQGGKGCGGGGAVGGRGGASLGVVSDLESLGHNTLPAWLSITASGALAPGGAAGVGGADGASGGSYSCSVPAASVNGVSGVVGVSATSVVLPQPSCADVKSVDSNFVPGSSQWVLDGSSKIVSAICN